jgi:hypothetical protein
MALTNGLVVMTPSSVAKTGASSTATINADGSVTFGSCETLSLNGVFTSAYDNYMVTVRHVGTGSQALGFRLRAGTDNSTASSYVRQYIEVNGTSVAGARATDNIGYISSTYSTQRDGFTAYFFGPYLAQPTAVRSVTVAASSSAYMIDYAVTHNQSTAYDGFTFIPSSSNFSGLVTVFGFNQ